MNRDLADKTTKGRIFETAVRLFASKGYAGTSIRELAKEVGIKESSIYNHFNGKRAILDAILEYQINSLNDAIISEKEIEELMGEYTDPVKFWMDGSADFLKKMPPLTGLIGTIVNNEMYLDERCSQFVLHTMIPATKRLTEMLLRYMDKKGMIREIDIPKTAKQYVYMSQGMEKENKLMLMNGVDPREVQKNSLETMLFFISGLRK